MIEIGHSPGSGNVANARHIWNALRFLYTVHILVFGSEKAVKKVFEDDSYVAADSNGNYDLWIVPGQETSLLGRGKSILKRKPRWKMALPPPFCQYLFDPPTLYRNEKKFKELILSNSLPFLPLTKNWKAIKSSEDYGDLKKTHFPKVQMSNVFFIVTYLGLGDLNTDAFDHYEEHIIILNFGTYSVRTAAKNVVSLKRDRLSMPDFEECLLQCTTFYPAITDGANTVGTLQSLELPYYDVIKRRVDQDPEDAFLNYGACDMRVFRRLRSRAQDPTAFAQVAAETRAYYSARRQARQGGRGQKIQFLVKELLK